MPQPRLRSLSKPRHLAPQLDVQRHSSITSPRPTHATALELLSHPFTSHIPQSSTMDFAPYQSSPPEHSRPFSPPRSGPTSPRASLDRRPYSPSQPHQQSTTSPPPLQHPQPQRTWSGGIPSPSYYQNAVSPAAGNGQQDSFLGGFGGDASAGGGGSSSWGDRGGFVSEFDTSLGIRLDYEACLAYLASPPLGAILLLILERKSDYVR